MRASCRPTDTPRGGAGGTGNLEAERIGEVSLNQREGVGGKIGVLGRHGRFYFKAKMFFLPTGVSFGSSKFLMRPLGLQMPPV